MILSFIFDETFVLLHVFLQLERQEQIVYEKETTRKLRKEMNRKNRDKIESKVFS